MQGFPLGWTQVSGARERARWRLVGNAGSVPIAQWIGEMLTVRNVRPINGTERSSAKRWPPAGLTIQTTSAPQSSHVADQPA